MQKMNTDIILLGLNHKTAPVEVREKYALKDYPLGEISSHFSPQVLKEILILSTCNRVEFLGVGQKEKIIPGILRFWANICQGSEKELGNYVYIYQDLTAIKHVFKVASSLDSLVVGEPQILGQLKTAYRKALEAGTCKTILNRLMHKAFFTAKRVRTETQIASKAVSISYAAVKLAQKIFGNLSQASALLIGAGEMAELAALHLLHSGVKQIYIVNRTLSNAQELAKRFKGKAIPYSDLDKILIQADIVISSTGAPHTIITSKQVKAIIKKRKYQPMFFIDIAVPRDIDPDLNQLDNVFLYDIDDLQEIVEENMVSRQEEAKKAEAIIEEETIKFKEWLQKLELAPTIKELMQKGEALAQKEAEKTSKKLNLSPQEAKQLQVMAKALVKKLYANPISFLKKTQQSTSSLDYLDLFRKIFNLDENKHFYHKKNQ